MREFSEADVAYLRFLLQLKQTGMSLDDIMAFTEDGCMLERLQRGDEIPHAVARKRLALLRQHQQRLYDKRRTLDTLFMAVERKLAFYARYQVDPAITTP